MDVRKYVKDEARPSVMRILRRIKFVVRPRVGQENRRNCIYCTTEHKASLLKRLKGTVWDVVERKRAVRQVGIGMVHRAEFICVIENSE